MKENDSHPISILPQFDRGQLSVELQDKLSQMSLEAHFMEYDGMQEFMQDILDPDTDRETRLSFEDEGYDMNYAGETNGFYELGPRPQVILNIITELNEKGVDTRRIQQVFHEIAGSVWRNAPKYYETRPEQYKVELPEDYDSETPYPEVFGNGKEDI